MIRRPPRSTRTDTLFPYTTLFRSRARGRFVECAAIADPDREAELLARLHPRDHRHLAARVDREVARLLHLDRQLPHDWQRDLDEVLDARLLHPEREKMVCEPIAVAGAVLLDTAAIFSHPDPPEPFPIRWLQPVHDHRPSTRN